MAATNIRSHPNPIILYGLSDHLHLIPTERHRNTPLHYSHAHDRIYNSQLMCKMWTYEYQRDQALEHDKQTAWDKIKTRLTILHEIKR